MTINRPLTSNEVLAFLPINKWTKVILLSSTPDKYGIYMVTTEDKKKKRLEDMEKISTMSNLLEKVEHFKLFKTVAVEIDGDWYRGKLLCYNEFLPNDTVIELIDVGSVYETKLQNIYELPFILYDPLSLPIRFKKNFIPKTKELTIRPLLSESFLHEGAVIVDVRSNIDLDNIQNEKQQLEVKKDLSTPKIQNITNNNSDVNVLSSFLSKSLMNGYYTQIKTKQNNFVLKNGDYCIITFFEDFTCLYVCKAFKKDENDYDVLDMDLILKTAESTDKIPLPNPVVGDIVKVYSFEFENLFRAKVLRKKKDGSYVVYFIDYGNTETVQSDDIYKLADELKKPGLAVKVGMNDLNNDIKCTNEVKQIFVNYAEKQTPFIIEFYEESENFIENVILKDAVNGYYINSSFIKNNLLKKSELESDTQTNKNTSLVHNSYNDYHVNNLKNNDTVYLKHFENMSSVFIIKDVKLFNEVMINTIKDESDLRKTDFIEGDIVKVILKNCVYRAEIKKINVTSVDVINVDIGYSDSIQSDSIYELPDALKKIPGLAIKVGIKKPILKKSSSILKFINNIETVPLYLKFDEKNLNKYQDVILNRVDNSQNIFEEFLKTSITVENTLQKIEDKFTSNGIGNTSVKEELINEIKPCLMNNFENIQLENGDYCFISYFKDFKNIYLCKAVKDCSDNSYKLHNLSIIEETLLSEDCKTMNNPAVGDIVKVLSPTFEGFYRAEIKNVINSDFYVSHIDFGSAEVVKLNNIFELSNELKKENKLPFKVSIEVPPNAEKNEDIEMLFTNLIDNHVVLSIEIKNKSTKGLVENVILKELESGNLVNDKVLKLLPNQKPKAIQNGQICYLRHFENFDSIYVSKIEDSQILYDTIQSTDRKTKANPVIGDVIKVLSPSFEDFYRAEIINIVGNAKYLVFYIDFGNTEIVQSNDLFELSDSLNKKPGVAVKIGINMPHNVEPNDGIKNMFSDLAENEEPIIIEFNESSDIGLKNCILKVKSSDILINDKVTELVSNQSSILNKINDFEMKIEENLKPSDIKSSQIKPKLLKNGEKVFFRYFHNSNSVFVGQGSDEPYQQFLTVIEKTATDISRIKKSNIETGDIVKAKFVDGDMYRAKILKKVDEDHYCILFIDFGNQNTVHVNDIFELPNELKLIPGLCIEIGIKGLPIIDETKKKMVTDSLEQLQLELTPLYIEYDENIPNGLKEATLKYYSDNRSVFDDIFKKNNILNIKGLNGHFKRINSGDQVKMLFGYNICNIFVQNSKLYDDFKHILEQLKILKPENLISVNPKINEYVAVFSGKYNGCCRAKVIGLEQSVCDSAMFFKCALIDFGCHETISSKNIFELPDEYTIRQIPSMVHKVKLSGLTNIYKNKKIDSYLSSLAGKQFVLEFADGCFENAVLKDIKSKKSLNQEIQELIINDSPPVFQQRRLERKIVLPSKVENELEKPSHPIKNGASVYITHFENFNSIFIRDGSFECNVKFDDFKKQILKYCRIANTKELVNIGDNVCVLCNAMYSRAIVKDKIGEDYLVFCLDVGNTELVNIDDIYELPNELKNKPPYFAIKVQLKNMPPIPSKRETEAVREYFENKFILPKTKLSVEFDELNPKGLENVTLRTEFIKKDICDELKDLLNNQKTGSIQNGQNFNPNVFTKLPYSLRTRDSTFR